MPKASSLYFRLLRIHNGLERPRPGFFTSRQWAVKWSVSESSARQMLVFGLRQGLIVRESFRINSGTRVLRCPHYAEVKSSNKAKLRR
jgi:hypothetical protein